MYKQWLGFTLRYKVPNSTNCACHHAACPRLWPIRRTRGDSLNEALYPVLHPEDGPPNYLGSVGRLANCHHDLSKVYMHLSLKSTLFLPKHHPGSNIQKGERGNQVECGKVMFGILIKNSWTPTPPHVHPNITSLQKRCSGVSF